MTKRIMTPEQRERLLGNLPIPKSGYRFIPEFPKDLKEFAPVFYIRGFTTDEYKSYVSDCKAIDEEEFPKIVIKYAQLCIINAENVFDLSTGQEMEVPKKKGKLDEDFLKGIPIMMMNQIYQKILSLSGLKVEEQSSESEVLDQQNEGLE